MTITDFATQHRLKTKHDKGDDTTIIPGKAGQLYEYSDEEFAVMYFLPATKPARPRVWNRMRGPVRRGGHGTEAEWRQSRVPSA